MGNGRIVCVCGVGIGLFGSSMRTCLCSTVPPPPREGRGGTFRDDEICLVRHCQGEGKGEERGREKGVGEGMGVWEWEYGAESMYEGGDTEYGRGGGGTTAWNARERECYYATGLHRGDGGTKEARNAYNSRRWPSVRPERRPSVHQYT